MHYSYDVACLYQYYTPILANYETKWKLLYRWWLLEKPVKREKV
jgi:hypothetical protein